MTGENGRERALIEEALRQVGLTADRWEEDEDGAKAIVGRWSAIEDDPGEAFFVGDEGVLTACVVGAAKYDNERVLVAFQPDGMEVGAEVRGDIFDVLGPIDR